MNYSNYYKKYKKPILINNIYNNSITFDAKFKNNGFGKNYFNFSGLFDKNNIGNCEDFGYSGITRLSLNNLDIKNYNNLFNSNKQFSDFRLYGKKKKIRVGKLSIVRKEDFYTNVDNELSLFNKSRNDTLANNGGGLNSFLKNKIYVVKIFFFSKINNDFFFKLIINTRGLGYYVSKSLLLDYVKSKDKDNSLLLFKVLSVNRFLFVESSLILYVTDLVIYIKKINKLVSLINLKFILFFFKKSIEHLYIKFYFGKIFYFFKNRLFLFVRLVNVPNTLLFYTSSFGLEKNFLSFSFKENINLETLFMENPRCLVLFENIKPILNSNSKTNKKTYLYLFFRFFFFSKNKSKNISKLLYSENSLLFSTIYFNFNSLIRFNYIFSYVENFFFFLIIKHLIFILKIYIFMNFIV